MEKLIHSILIFVFCLPVLAQQDSVLFELPVIIEDSLLRYSSPGSQSKPVTDRKRNEDFNASLDRILGRNNNIYIKSYGPGMLANSSIRGGLPGHTLVLWNGIPIQSPLVGQLDISLINTNQFSQIVLQRGGNSSLWGSGAIGGLISLDDISEFKNMLQVNLASSVASFNNRQVQASLVKSSSLFYSRSSYQLNKAENNFSYRVGGDKKVMQNAAQSQHHLKQDIAFVLSPSIKLSINYWGIISDREIPATTQQSQSEAFQKDAIHRITTRLNKSFRRSVLIGKLAYFHERLEFSDPQILLKSNTGFNTLVGDLNYDAQLGKKHRWMTGITGIVSNVHPSSNYPQGTNEHRYAFFTSLELNPRQWLINIAARQEVLGDNFLDFVPQLAIEYKGFEHWQFKSKLSKNFRYPSINDRFWIPGGNPELKSESGWSAESTIAFLAHTERTGIKLSLSVFNRFLDNLIQWAPGTQAYWSALNLTQVWSRGLEWRAQYRFKNENIAFSADAGIDFIRSTSRNSIDRPKITKGEQIWYTPERTYFLQVQGTKKSYQLQINYNYTSETRGLNAMVGSYHILMMRLSKAFDIKLSSIKLWLSIDNFLNQDYRVIEFRPMPGRNIEIGIHYNITKRS